MKVSSELKSHFGENGVLPENKDYSCQDIQTSVHREELTTTVKNSRELALP